jgi:hypothetical protein
LHILRCIATAVKSRTAENAAWIRENSQNFGENVCLKEAIRKGIKWKDNVKINVNETTFRDVAWITLADNF